MADVERPHSPFRVRPDVGAIGIVGEHQQHLSSRELSEQIKQLEEEGSKLMTATHSLSDSLGYNPHSATSQSLSPQRLPISALTDISGEQRTLNHIREQLEDQARDTERLSQELSSSASGAGRYAASLPYAASGSLSKLDIPGTKVGASANSFSHHNDAQREIIDLRTRLAETLHVAEQQKENFRINLSEVKTKLQEAAVQRDTVLQSRKRDLAERDTLNQRLQRELEKAHQTNRLQEQTVLELSTKLDSVQKEGYSADTVMSHIRSLLVERERVRGSSYYDTEPVSSQPVAMLAHIMERCIREMEAELQATTDKLLRVNRDHEQLKLSSEEQGRNIEQQYQYRIEEIKKDHEQTLELLQQRSHNTKSESSTLEEQIAILQTQSVQQEQFRQEQIKDLDDRLKLLKTQYSEEKHAWADKRSGLEHAVEESQKELALLKGERDDAIRKSAAIESRFSDMQQSIGRLSQEVETQNDDLHRMAAREANYHDKEGRLVEEIRGKTSLIIQLERALEDVKQEAHSHMQQTIISLEKEGKELAANEISKLATQLSAVTDKCHQLTLELEVTRSEQRNLQDRYTEQKVTYEKVHLQLEQEQGKREHINNLLKDRTGDNDRLSNERDYYFKLLEERNNEIASLRTIKDRLSVQLEEREKNFLALQDQNDKMALLTETNMKTTSNIKMERDEMMHNLNAKVTEVEGLRHSREDLSKKIKQQDEHLSQVEEENVNLADENKNIRQDLQQLIKEKEGLITELKRSRYDVSALRDEQSTIQKRVRDKEVALRRELNRLVAKLKTTEHDLKLAKRTLRTREHVDGKAVKVAGKMQKAVTEKRGEIDSLQSKLRWLEECLEAALKDKKLLEEDRLAISGSAQRTGDQNERLTSELRNYMNQNQELRERLASQQALLDKSAVQQAVIQAQAEEYEQDLTRLRLKHQLDLKEAGGSTAVMIPSQAAPCEWKKPVASDEKKTVRTRSSDRRLTRSPNHKPRSRSYERDKPVCIKPEVARKAANKKGVGGELTRLLDEMRNLVGTEQFAEELVTNEREMQQPEGSFHNLHTSKRSTGRKGQTARQQRTDDNGADGRESPVTELLGSMNEDKFSEVTLSETDLHNRCPQVKHKGKPTRVDSDAQQLCRRLEKKIQSLSKLGGHLQSENKEMARIMANEGKKIHKVKVQMAK